MRIKLWSKNSDVNDAVVLIVNFKQISHIVRVFTVELEEVG